MNRYRHIFNNFVCLFIGHKKMGSSPIMQIDKSCEKIIVTNMQFECRSFDIKKVITIELCDRCHAVYWKSHSEILPLTEME